MVFTGALLHPRNFRTCPHDGDISVMRDVKANTQFLISIFLQYLQVIKYTVKLLIAIFLKKMYNEIHFIWRHMYNKNMNKSLQKIQRNVEMKLFTDELMTYTLIYPINDIQRQSLKSWLQMLNTQCYCNGYVFINAIEIFNCLYSMSLVMLKSIH